MQALPLHIVFEALAVLLLYALARTVYARVRRRAALRDLPGPPPSSFLVGCLDQFFSPGGLAFHERLTDEYGSAAKVWGALGEPQVYLSDPRGLEAILLKQADIFEEPDMLLRMHRVFFGDGVGSATGKKHKKHRRRLGPSLTPNMIRRMAPQFYSIAHELRSVFAKQVAGHGGTAEVDVSTPISRAALEFIARGGMGHSFGALDADGATHHPYAAASNDLSPQASRIPPVLFELLHPFTTVGTPAFRRFLSRLVPLAAVDEIRRILKVMDTTVLEIFHARRAALASDKENADADTPNIISNLLSENEHVSAADRLSEEEIIGQMNSLIFAAHDTTSGSLSRILHVLAHAPTAQAHVRAEVTAARAAHGDLDYDALAALPWLDAVCREVLRLHPPVPSMMRIAKQDTVIPLAYPVTRAGGPPLKQLALRRGTVVHVGINGSNQDARTWGADARVFRPERWLAPLPESVRNARVPGIWANLMTFFGGPRSCMGMRFSLLEMKIVLSVLLEAFVFTPGTPGVEWQMVGIMAPCAAGDAPGVHRLPLVVTRVQ